MKPRLETINQELIEIFSLAHTYYVSAITLNKFVPYQYIKHEIEKNTDSYLIEKILSIAIKIRFLDDKIKILREKDRNNLAIGKLYIENEKEEENINIRFALNKLIHHEKISIKTESLNIFVAQNIKDENPEPIQIPSGKYEEIQVLINTEGHHNKKKWKFELDLFILINEILRVFH